MFTFILNFSEVVIQFENEQDLKTFLDKEKNVSNEKFSHYVKVRLVELFLMVVRNT